VRSIKEDFLRQGSRESAPKPFGESILFLHPSTRHCPHQS
jgi:hypothetical protein